MKKNNKISIFILIFLMVSLFFPLLEMFIQADWTQFSNLLVSNSFKEAFSNSLLVTIISTIISITVAYLLAYALNRTNIKRRAVLKLFITLPMLVPSISIGLGLINLFGTNGILTNIFKINIIGIPGIIIGSVLYSFPVAFLMLCDGFNYIDNNMYATAKVLNLNKWQTFKTVTFPYLKKPIFSSIFTVFTLIFTDYGVPLAVGGKFITLPVFLYKEVIGLLDFSTGTMIGVILLIPAFISFAFDSFSKDYSNGEHDEKEFVKNNNKIRDSVFSIYTYLVIAIILLIIFSFIYYAFINNVKLDPSLSLNHVKYVMNDGIGKYTFNSLLISILVAVFGTIISYFTAYVTARVGGKLSRIVHLFAIATLAIPGIVLGLSYTITFNSTFIYNTFIILILVNIIHFMASPYLMAYNALNKVNKNYEVVAKTCGISNFRIIKDVIIPSTKLTIREMIAYFFVNSMVTISAITFLYNSDTMPLSLLINTYENNMMLGEAAIISIIILFFNILVKVIVYIINRIEDRRNLYGNNI